MNDTDRINVLEKEFYEERAKCIQLEKRLEHLENELVLLKADHSLLKRKLAVK